MQLMMNILMQTRSLKTDCLSKPFIYASEVIVLILESFYH